MRIPRPRCVFRSTRAVAPARASAPIEREKAYLRILHLAAPVDARSDVYSAGVVLYRLVAGRQPFTPPKTLDRERAFVELMRQHLEVTPPAPSTVAPQALPEELDAAILKSLAKRPEERFSSAAAFADELERVAATMQEQPMTRAPRALPTSTELMPKPSQAPAGWSPRPASAHADDAPPAVHEVPDAVTMPVSANRRGVAARPRAVRSAAIYVAIAVASAIAFTFALLRAFTWWSSR